MVFSRAGLGSTPRRFASHVDQRQVLRVPADVPRDERALRNHLESADARILERLALRTKVTRRGASVPVVLVADAWDGEHIEPVTSIINASSTLLPPSPPVFNSDVAVVLSVTQP